MMPALLRADVRAAGAAAPRRPAPPAAARAARMDDARPETVSI
jgi:hypothetical protein